MDTNSSRFSGEKVLEELSRVKTLVDERIREFFPEKITYSDLERIAGKGEFEYDVKAVRETLVEPFWNFLSRGGKRWRPYLFLIILEALTDRETAEKYLDVSIIPEIIHNGSIVVDDIEDGGELRRGKPSLHKIYGVDVAINLGNFKYFFPMKILERYRLEEGTLNRLYRAYIEEMVNIHIGQAMDIHWHNQKSPNVAESQYLKMCSFKTGTLARLAARMAVILSKRPPEIEKKFGEFAEKIGVAFQIQDDILDIRSTEDGDVAFGKQFGNDIKEGKRTLIVIHALSKATEEDKRALNKILSTPAEELGKKNILKAVAIMQKYGALKYAQDKARYLVEEAFNTAEDLFSQLNIRNEASQRLKHFAHFLIERKV